MTFGHPDQVRPRTGIKKMLATMESDPTNKLPHVNPSIHLGENSLAPLNEKSTLL